MKYFYFFIFLFFSTTLIYAGDRKICFDYYRAKKINKQELMICTSTPDMASYLVQFDPVSKNKKLQPTETETAMVIPKKTVSPKKMLSKPKMNTFSDAFDKIDIITLSGFYDINTKRIGANLYYKNSATDRLISWENEIIFADFYIYENNGDLINPRRGVQIQNIKNKELTRSFQTTYFQVDPKKYKNVLLVCSVYINGKLHTMSESVILGNDPIQDLKRNTFSTHIEHVDN